MPDTGNSSATPVAPLPDLVELVKVPVNVNSDGAPSLVGSRCEGCGAAYFPRRLVCYECRSAELQEHLLSRRGTLYSWTTVHVSSSRPTPYTVGYVDLPENVRIFTTLRADRGPLDFDQPVQLEAGPDGGWAFHTAQ
ncbi:OB-fold domain-containing protein [Streptomyces canus]|uniref:Zn-ribbon domain-containing OB-fold protein n=1 Tax=Streptomyces canus TaxID=58343 RepID=UPI0033FC246C